MVENSTFCTNNEVDNEYCTELEGSTHIARVIVAAQGAIVVRLQISGIIYTGVLLDASKSR